MKYAVTEYTAKHGSKGLIISVPEAPVVSMSFNFRAGYRYADDYDTKAQVPHIMEHMVSGSCDKYRNPMEFEAIFTKNGAYNNAMTSSTSLWYVANCADFEWQRILELMREQICRPYFGEKMFQSELGNVRSELTGNLSKPGRMLSPLLAKNMGSKNKTYPEYIATLDNITMQDVANHHSKTHTAGNMRFVIAGDFDDKLDELKEMLDEFKLPVGERYELIADDYHSTKPTVIERSEVPGITFEFSSIIMRELNDAECAAMNALNHILTGTMSSRIYGKAREMGILYGCYSGTSSSKYNDEWYFGGQANDDKFPAVFDLIANELNRIKNGEIDDQDIEDARTYAMGRFRMGIQTAGQMANYLAGRYYYDEFIKNYDDEPLLINGVTKEQMVELAREFFDANIWGIGLYGATTSSRGDELQAKLSKLF